MEGDGAHADRGSMHMDGGDRWLDLGQHECTGAVGSDWLVYTRQAALNGSAVYACMLVATAFGSQASSYPSQMASSHYVEPVGAGAGAGAAPGRRIFGRVAAAPSAAACGCAYSASTPGLAPAAADPAAAVAGAAADAVGAVVLAGAVALGLAAAAAVVAGLAAAGTGTEMAVAAVGTVMAFTAAAAELAAAAGWGGRGGAVALRLAGGRGGGAAVDVAA